MCGFVSPNPVQSTSPCHLLRISDARYGVDGRYVAAACQEPAWPVCIGNERWLRHSNSHEFSRIATSDSARPCSIVDRIVDSSHFSSHSGYDRRAGGDSDISCREFAMKTPGLGGYSATNGVERVEHECIGPSDLGFGVPMPEGGMNHANHCETPPSGTHSNDHASVSSDHSNVGGSGSASGSASLAGCGCLRIGALTNSRIDSGLSVSSQRSSNSSSSSSSNKSP